MRQALTGQVMGGGEQVVGPALVPGEAGRVHHNSGEIRPFRTKKPGRLI